MNKNHFICLDTQISNWIIRDNRDDVDEKVLFDKANDLIPKLEKLGYKLLIPNIVLSEMACIYSEAIQNRFFNGLPKGLYTVDFTASTSRILGRLLHTQYESKSYKKNSIVKVKMKYDVMILACAIDYGALCFYTEDRDFSIYNNKGLIDICSLSDLPPDYNDDTLFETSTK